MWYVFQVLIACILVLLALFLSWFVVWRLVLSQLGWFQEIFGLRSARAIEIDQLKKRKQQQANTFILTRSGQQAEKNREGWRAAAIMKQQRQTRPTTTPTYTTPNSLHQSFIDTEPSIASSSANTALPAFPSTPSSVSTPTPTSHTTPGAKRRRKNSGSTSSNTQTLTHSAANAKHTQPQSHHSYPSQSHQSLNLSSLSVSSSSLSLTSLLTPTVASSHPHHSSSSSQPITSLPTTNSDAAAFAAEALHRRQNSGRLSHNHSLSSHGNESSSSHTHQSSSTPTTIGGTGWLQQASIIEDYRPEQTK